MATASTETLSNAAAARPRRGTRAYLILTAFVLLGLAAYFGFRAISAGKEGTDDAQVDADVVPVAARVAGAIVKNSAKDNQPVKKGDVLVEIDPRDYQAKVKQKEAELDAAKAQAAAADAQMNIVAATSKGGLSAARAMLSGTATSVGSADAQVEAAKAALARAQAEASRAESDLSRAEALRKDEAIPQAQVDTARANAESARAAVALARANLASAEETRRTAQTRVSEAQGRVEQSAPVDAQLAVAKANADLAHARVASAEGALDEARLQLEYTKIVAPSDGTLSKLAVREGQLVQAGQQLVAVVPAATYVTANFKETQVGEMHKGQRAVIEIDAFPGRKLEGIVDSTSPGTGARFSLLPPDNASGNFVKVVQRVPVKIAWSSLPNDVRVAAGMSCDVTVYTR
jgi:membrane fusion protein (multidrug efflux system)